LRAQGLFRAAFKKAAAALVLGGMLAGSFAGVASAARPPITFQIFIGDSCVSGTAKSDSFLKVIITDRSGIQKGRGAVETDPEGNWSACLQQGIRPMAPGDKVAVTDFESGQKRSFKVPTLTGRVDRGSNVVSGKAPTGTTVEVEAFDFRFDLWGEQYDSVQHVPATNGGYSYDFDNAGVDIKGGASVVIRWRSGADVVMVGRFQIAPYVVLALGQSDFAGASGPNRLAQLTLSGSGGVLASGNGVGSYGDTTFYGDFADEDGERYFVQGGEQLNAPVLGASSSWRVPRIAGKADLVNDVVSGNCFANGRFVTLAQGPGGFGYGLGFGTAKPDGTFSVDLTDQVDMVKGFRVGILCYSAEGDEVSQEFVTR
jgi:hypothetical protein